MTYSLFRNIFLTSFIIRTTRNIFYIGFLWQLKEYRIDRMFSHLKTPIGRKLLLSPISMLKWVSLLIFIFVMFRIQLNIPAYPSGDDLITFSLLTVWLLWAVEAVIYTRELIMMGWKVPKFTLKALLILITALASQFYPVITNGIYAPLILAPILDRFLPVVIFLSIIVFNLATELFKHLIVKKARYKLSSYPDLKIIGITGSYGKTSTKEFLSSILKTKFTVSVPTGSTNTILGIANHINKNLNDKDQIFIVEMGAYKREEIKNICALVHPVVGIITGIGDQHLQLFGSQQNIIRGKEELILSLSKGGIAVFNGNNKFCREMAQRAQKLNLKVMVTDQKKSIFACNEFKDHLEITIKNGKKKTKTRIYILGKHNLENLVMAMECAEVLGLTKKEIIDSLINITSPQGTLKQVAGKGRFTLVDDTFNSSTTGVKAAISYMKLFKNKRILILSPLIELGENDKAIHKQIGQLAVAVCDYIYLTNRNYFQEILAGATSIKNGKNKIKLIDNTLYNQIEKMKLDSESVILFEGKESHKYLKLFTKK